MVLAAWSLSHSSLFFNGSFFPTWDFAEYRFFPKEDAYMITLLYVVMPINDARITWICYGYPIQGISCLFQSQKKNRVNL